MYIYSYIGEDPIEVGEVNGIFRVQQPANREEACAHLAFLILPYFFFGGERGFVSKYTSAL